MSSPPRDSANAFSGPHPDSATLAMILVLMALIFWFDVATPHDDVSISFLYSIPIFVTIFSNRLPPYLFATLTTLLSCTGAFIQTPRETLDLVFFTNRGIAIGAQWLVAFVVATRKSAEAIMRAEYEAERTKVETSRRFMDVLSHEIGTSLTMIDGQAFRLRKLGEASEPLDLSGRTEKIRNAVRHIEVVVRQVQLASEIGEGAISINRTPVPIASLIDDVVREAPPERTIVADLAALPPTISADADMLRQVFANLLSNAIKYSPADQPVRVFAATRPNEVAISISDAGRGIPEDERARLSEPYFRARNSHGVHGTGLGLYVAHRFVANHGGRLDIDSELGVGTTVTVRLPFNRALADFHRETTPHPVH